ncbi:hypothetical protein BZG36_01320 [Bifiguratus adelaidae]|uniref:Kinesin motor domain-containing protein n=1 Tax=Bifiguratus adelaidae TaxID=1938954 RepID=A0A261Y587_9FUNG|nr:hypothetical protein BZG36_01320 [Bifiguratus adelaidae]
MHRDVDRSTVNDMKSAAPQKKQGNRRSLDIDPNGTNIQVVVRCRGRIGKEVRDASTIAVRTSAVRGREVTVQPYENGIDSGKTYTFDRVFGPEAGQEHVFNDVVKPILEEVLLGYNCTIFAYGQTGTGKTWTMEGDMEPQFNTYKDTAGIIPRTLFALFEQLEATTTDFSVKVSSIELYNEELNDLLSQDDTGQKKLRLFDDFRGKGVNINGLEETLIKTAMDGIRVMQKSSLKKRIAATKCNDKSSRSHCVFTITVHSKEVALEGDEFLKVGKLNLVDLAGSENIGRSGAEKSRAREAGMINQSLLTLGRVINALVDHSPHIPYRESKLTRLLQDSLGGRTKTCIIATISPGRNSIEETMSTLDYANRAKDIRNKPEINQKMTKSVLLKDYVTEIERLKSDLLAARDKSGIFLSEDSYVTMTQELQSRKDQVEELQRHVMHVEEECRKTEEKFQQSAKVLRITKAELETTKTELEKATSEIDALRSQLRNLKEQIEKEIQMRKEVEEKVEKLKAEKLRLTKSLQECEMDLSQLYLKLDRHEELQNRNKKTFVDFRESVAEDAKKLQECIDNLGKDTDSFHTDILRKIRNVLSDEEKLRSSMTADSQNIKELLDGNESHLSTAAEEVTSRFEKTKRDLQKLSVETISESAETAARSQKLLFSLLDNVLEEVKSHSQQMKRERDDVQNRLNVFYANISGQFERQRNMLAETKAQQLTELNDCRIQLAEQKKSIGHITEALAREWNKFMGDFINKFERVSTDMLTRTLLDVDTFGDQTEAGLQRMNEAMQGLMSEAQRAREEAQRQNKEETERLQTQIKKLQATFLKITESTKAQHEALESRLAGGLDTLKTSVSVSTSQTQNVLSSLKKLSEDVQAERQSAYEQYSKRLQQLKEGYKQVKQLLLDKYAYVGEEIQKQQHIAIGKNESVANCVKELGTMLHEHTNLSSGTLKEITNAMPVSISSGTTPKRKERILPPLWNKPATRADILSEYRSEGFYTMRLGHDDKDGTRLSAADAPASPSPSPTKKQPDSEPSLQLPSTEDLFPGDPAKIEAEIESLSVTLPNIPLACIKRETENQKETAIPVFNTRVGSAIAKNHTPTPTIPSKRPVAGPSSNSQNIDVTKADTPTKTADISIGSKLPRLNTKRRRVLGNLENV